MVTIFTKLTKRVTESPRDLQVHVPNFDWVSRSDDRSGDDNSIQFINFGRVGNKSFKEWRQTMGSKGG